MNTKHTPAPIAGGPYTRISFQFCRNAFGPSFWLVGVHHANGVSWASPESRRAAISKATGK